MPASLFERLADTPEGGRGAAVGLRGQLSRDLEHLLNTRSEGMRMIPEAFVECRKSSLTFGIPDFSAYSLLSVQDRERVRRALEQAVGLHEPRLGRVRITLEPQRDLERTLRFRIDAVVAQGEDREKIRFDAVLQLSTQVYQVA